MSGPPSKGKGVATAAGPKSDLIGEFLTAYKQSSVEQCLEADRHDQASPITSFLANHGYEQCGKKTFGQLVDYTATALDPETTICQLSPLVALRPGSDRSVEVLNPLMTATRVAPVPGDKDGVMSLALLHSLDGEAVQPIAEDTLASLTRSLVGLRQSYPSQEQAIKSAGSCLSSAFKKQNQQFCLSFAEAPSFSAPQELDETVQRAIIARLVIPDATSELLEASAIWALRQGRGALDQSTEARLRRTRNALTERTLEPGWGKRPKEAFRREARAHQERLTESSVAKQLSITVRLRAIEDSAAFASRLADSAKLVKDALDKVKADAAALEVDQVLSRSLAKASLSGHNTDDPASTIRESPQYQQWTLDLALTKGATGEDVSFEDGRALAAPALRRAMEFPGEPELVSTKKHIYSERLPSKFITVGDPDFKDFYEALRESDGNLPAQEISTYMSEDLRRKVLLIREGEGVQVLNATRKRQDDSLTIESYFLSTQEASRAGSSTASNA